MRFFLFLFCAHGMAHRTIPSRDQTHAASSGNTESQPLDCLGSLKNFFKPVHKMVNSTNPRQSIPVGGGQGRRVMWGLKEHEGKLWGVSGCGRD